MFCGILIFEWGNECESIQNNNRDSEYENIYTSHRRGDIQLLFFFSVKRVLI